MKLTDTQLVLLSAAAQRQDGAVERGSKLKGGASLTSRAATPQPAGVPRPQRRRRRRLPLYLGASTSRGFPRYYPHAGRSWRDVFVRAARHLAPWDPDRDAPSVLAVV
jgi:hypothetical protein